MSSVEIFHRILSLMLFYCGALDQHLTILKSAFKCEGGGHGFESDRISILVLPSDRAFIDIVTFNIEVSLLFFFGFSLRALS